MVGYRRVGARLVCAALLATVVGALCASAKTADAQTWHEQRLKRPKGSRISALSTSDRTRSVSLGKALEAAAGYSETVVYQLWQNDEWVDYLRHTVWYASEGYPVSEREQMWDATGGAWVNSDSAAELYGPGGLGEHEGYENYSWDDAAAEWKLAEAEWDEVDTTDGDGNPMVLSDVRAHRALNDDLVLQWETAETYDSQDRIIRIVAREGQSGWIWPMDEPDEEVTSSIQIDYTYDESGGWREDWVCVADTNGDATMDTLRGAWRFVQTSDTDVLEQYDLYSFDSPTDSAVVFKLCRGFDNGEQVFDSLLVYDETASEWITYGVIAEVVLPNGFEEYREWVKEFDDGLGVIVGEYEKAVEGIDATTGAFLYAESLFVWTPDPGEWTFVAYGCETEFLHDSGYGESGELDTATGEWDKWKMEWGVILPDWRWDELELYWLNDGAEWVPYNNFTRTDSGGVVIGVYDRWNEGSGEYVNDGRSVLYAFDADSNALSRIDYQWDDGYWQRR
ncbi:MAG: hypothetical protein GF331_23290, partial [Chitinivibrionales bacterium]|nr:hypothetical protein [Chitinivibrionales bacterium]